MNRNEKHPGFSGLRRGLRAGPLASVYTCSPGSEMDLCHPFLPTFRNMCKAMVNMDTWI